jgi:hypothetical protein
VCPDCVPKVGGETSDFGGGSICSAEKSALTEELAGLFRVDEIAASHEGRFEQSLRWLEGEPGAELERSTTTLRGVIELGEAVYVASHRPECADRVEVPAALTLTTTDGALEAATAGSLRIDVNAPGGDLFTSADLSTAFGTVELALDAERLHAGRIYVRARREPDGLGGEIELEIRYFEDRESAEEYARGGQSLGAPGSRVRGVFRGE